MADQRDAFSSFIAAGKLADAAAYLDTAHPACEADLSDELAALRGDIVRLVTQERQRRIAREPAEIERARLTHQLLALRRLMPAESAPPAHGAVTLAAIPARSDVVTDQPSHAARRVFISYNHSDCSAAQSIAQALEAAGLDVVIDVRSMLPAQSIEEFIHQSVGTTAATACVLSRASLLSAWVAQETLLAFSAQSLWGSRRFIAAFIDADFFAPGFRVSLSEAIDTRLAELDSLRAKHAALHVDSLDIDAEHARLHALRHGLGAILGHLRNSLCLDLRGETQAASLKQLVAPLR